MDSSKYHQSVTYWPLTASFYEGDQSEAYMKNSSLKALASLVGKEQKLISKNVKFGMLAASLKNGGLYAAADPINLAFLQQIQLIRTVIGKPVEYFALDEFFSTLNVDMLQAREPIQGTFGIGDRLSPLEESEMNEAKFDEIISFTHPVLVPVFCYLFNCIDLNLCPAQM